MIQNRDGLPDAIAEEKRFFALYGNNKEDTPTGWNDPENWKHLDDIPEGKMFGFAIGNGTNYLFIDGDHVRDPKTGNLLPWVKEVYKRITRVATTYSEISMSGTGFHMICDLGDLADNFSRESNGYKQIIIQMDPDEYNNLPKDEKDKIPKIEFWYHAAGRYAVLTGKHGKLIQVAKDEAAASIFSELLKVREEFHQKYASGKTFSDDIKIKIDDKTKDRVLSALPYVSANSREIWVRVGQALSNCGFPFEVWDEWSQFTDQRSGELCDKYNPAETPKIWKSFKTTTSHWNSGTIFKLAKENGWCSAELEKPSLIVNKKGTPKALSLNYYSIIKFYFNENIWLNALDGRPTIEGVSWNAAVHAIRDEDLFRLMDFVAEKYEISNRDFTSQAITKIAHDNARHPIVELLSGLTWDGVPRIAELFPRYLGAERSEYTTAVTKLLFYGAIQRVFHPGVKFDYCIILADIIQGSGKSTMCQFMALKDEWYSDSLADLGNDKTVYETIRGHWIMELSEMIATRKTKTIEQIKACISKEADDYRDPYGVFPERRPRQCVFIGTTNKPQFLPEDKTGNRRFVPIICDGKKAEVHPRTNEAETRAYIEQVYAEALQTGEAEGWPLVLDPKFDEQLNAIREASTPDDPNVGIIQEWLDTTTEKRVCSRMIWDEVFKGDYDRQPQSYELQNIADIMNLKIVGWQKYISKAGTSDRVKFPKPYGAQRAWVKVVNEVVNEVVAGDDDFLPTTRSDEIPFFDD